MSSQQYRELEQLLKAQEWRKADKLTTKLMLFQVAGRKMYDWLDTEHIKALPCKDLRTIDQLWVHYSNGKFGFSVQKKLWLECGGKIGEYDYEDWKKFGGVLKGLGVWEKFGAKVGWYHPKNDGWRTYNEFMNDTQNAQKALPASLPTNVNNFDFLVSGMCVGKNWFGRGFEGVLLFSRAETCYL